MIAYADLGFVYVDDGDVVHLADLSSLGGYVTGCDTFGSVRPVTPVPDEDVCSECRADAESLRRDRSHAG